MNHFMNSFNFPFNGIMPNTNTPQPVSVGVPTWVINGTTYYNKPPPSAFANNQSIGPGTNTTSGTYQNPNGSYSNFTSTQNNHIGRNYHSSFSSDRRTNDPASSSSQVHTTVNNINRNSSYPSLPAYPNTYVNNGIDRSTSHIVNNFANNGIDRTISNTINNFVNGTNRTISNTVNAFVNNSIDRTISNTVNTYVNNGIDRTISSTVNNFGGSYGRQYPQNRQPQQLPWPLLQAQQLLPQVQSLLQGHHLFQAQQPLRQAQPPQRPQESFQTSIVHEQDGQHLHRQQDPPQLPQHPQPPHPHQPPPHPQEVGGEPHFVQKMQKVLEKAEKVQRKFERPQPTSDALPSLPQRQLSTAGNTPAVNGPLREAPQSFRQQPRRESPVLYVPPVDHQEARGLETQGDWTHDGQGRVEKEEHHRLQREENERKLREEQGRLAQKKRLAKDRENKDLERRRSIVFRIRQSQEREREYRERGKEEREKEKREKEKREMELDRAEIEKLREEAEERLVHKGGRVGKEREEREKGRSNETKGNGTAADPFVLDDNDPDEIVPPQAAAQTQPVVKGETVGEMVRELTVTPPPKALHGKSQTRSPSVTPSARIRATTPASATSSESSHVLPPTPTPAPRPQAARGSSAVHELPTTHRGSPSSPSTMRPSSAKRKRDEGRNLDEPGETAQKRPKESGEFVWGEGERAMESSG